MKKAIFLLLAYAALFLKAESVLACQCVSPPMNTEEEFRQSVAKAIDAADAVFSGEVIEVYEFRVRFRVREVWKGDFQYELTLATGAVMTEETVDGLRISPRGGCDFQFELNKSYLVFAVGPKDRLKSAHCSLTGTLVDTERVLEELKRLRQAAATPVLPPVAFFPHGIRKSLR